MYLKPPNGLYTPASSLLIQVPSFARGSRARSDYQMADPETAATGQARAHPSDEQDVGRIQGSHSCSAASLPTAIVNLSNLSTLQQHRKQALRRCGKSRKRRACMEHGAGVIEMLLTGRTTCSS